MLRDLAGARHLLRREVGCRVSAGMFADQAAAAATSDRVAVAEQLLDVACQEAIGILRLGAADGDPWAWLEANRVLGRAQYRAHRMLGPQSVAS